MQSLSRLAASAAIATSLLLGSIAFAQTASAPAAQRDPAAIAAVQKAIDGMGGSAAGAIKDGTAQASVQPTSDTKSSPYTITYKNAGDQFRIESVRDGKSVVTATDAIHYNRRNADGKTERLPAHMLPSEFPKYLVAAVLSRELQNPAYSLQYSGVGTINGRNAIFVSIRLEGDKDWAPFTAQVWSFDAVTGLPLRVDWVIPMVHSADTTVSASAEFGDFRSVSGVLIPFQITTYVDGTELSVETITSVSLNAGISPAQFQLGGTQ